MERTWRQRIKSDSCAAKKVDITSSLIFNPALAMVCVCECRSKIRMMSLKEPNRKDTCVHVSRHPGSCRVSSCKIESQWEFCTLSFFSAPQAVKQLATYGRIKRRSSIVHSGSSIAGKYTIVLCGLQFTTILQETIMDLPISVQMIVMKDSLWAHVRDSR